MTIHIAVLGVLSVMRDDSAERPIRGMQARTLLALTVNRPSRVTDSNLVEVCWPSNPVATAMNSVRNTVARLRQDLGPASIVRDGDGYVLGTDVELDLDDLDALLANATERQAADDVNGARVFIDRALALVRGEPFADVAHEPWAMPAANFWSERVAVAEDMYIALADAAVDLTSVARIRELARGRPEREERWLALARLMNRTGRRTDALRALNEARRALAQFGLEPGRELSTLERVALSGAEPSLLSRPERRRSRNTLVGRHELLEQIDATLVDTPALTLVGLGGVGKTRLALELARRTPLDNGAAIVDLTHAADDVDVVRQIAVAADIRRDVSAAADELERVVDVLAALPTLVVVDNADRHLSQVRGVVEALAGRLGETRLVITSRWPVDFAGEVVVTVPPLELPAGGDSRGGVGESPAIEMFFNHAHVVEPSEPTYGLVSDIVRFVGGNAFAIQLCASLTHTLPVEEVRHGLANSQRLLDLTSLRDRPGETLRSVFDNVVDRLAPQDRLVLARLGGFRAAFTLQAAQALIDPDGSDVPLVLSMSRLVRACLIHVGSGSPTTYYLDDLQASLARELLEQDGETERVSQQIDQYYVELAATLALSLRGPKQREAIAIISAEIGNIRYILDRTNPQLPPHHALKLAGSLGEYWFLTGQWAEGTRFIDTALARSPDERTVERAIALAFRPRVGGMWASVLHSHEHIREAIAIARDLGREDIVNEMTAFAGIAQMSRGEVNLGWSTVHQVAKSNGATPWAAAQARMLLGMANAVAGDLERAHDQCVISVNAMLALGDELNAATTLKNLGLMLQRHGDGEVAREHLEQAIRMSDGLMPGVDAQARCALAEIDAENGRVDEVGLHHLRSQLRKLGDFSGLTRANRVLARAFEQRGEVDQALHILQDSLLHVADHEEQALGLVLLDIADIKRRQGREADACTLHAAAKLLATGTGYGWSAKDRTRIGTTPTPSPTDHDDELTLVQRAIFLALM